MTAQIPENQPSFSLDRLVNQLHSRLGGRIRELRVLLQDGGVVLTGCTHTYHAKQLAQECVMEMTDLPILANEIKVN
jgi:hypothetical protein